MDRLQKRIASSGYCSRRNAEAIIAEGRVKVNGLVVREWGTKVLLTDIITIDEEVIIAEKKEYFLLNKPQQSVCTLKDNFGRLKVTDLIDSTHRLFPVGRLDYNTTGALILTNDGSLANQLTHPRYQVNKTYQADLDKDLDIEDLKPLKSGIIIDGIITAPAKAKILGPKRVELIIHEGRNRQVKKMFEALGYQVVKLNRVKYSFLDVSDLKEGESRHLSLDEIAKLQKEVNKKS